MNENKIRAALLLGIAGVIVATGVREMLHTREIERLKRRKILEGVGMDVSAIQNAADHVSTRIERGEIRSLGELQNAVETEIAFQKMAIREDSEDK